MSTIHTGADDVGNNSFLSINLGDSHFLRFLACSPSMGNNTDLSRGIVKREKSSSLNLIIYHYFKWGNGGVSIIFIHNFSSFQNLKRCLICKPQQKTMENLMKIQTLAKHFLLPALECPGFFFSAGAYSIGERLTNWNCPK